MHRRTPLAAAALAAALLVPSTAQAATVDEGATKIQFERSTLVTFTTLGIRVVSDPPASVAGRRSIVFPVTGGDVSPSGGTGFASHRGALILRRGSRTIAMRFPRLRIAREDGTLTARVGGRRLTVARVGIADARVRRDGIDTLVQGVRLELTSTAAAAIGRALGVRGLRGGLLLGRATSAFVFREVVVNGGGTTLTPDPAFTAALQGDGITLTPTGRTEVRPDGLLFPIVSGSVGRQTVVGRLRHVGGITLAKEGVRLPIDRFNIDIEPGSDLTAVVGDARVKIADVDVSQAVAGPSGRTPRTFLVRGLVFRLTASAASALNAALSTSAFTAGQVIGTANLAARAR